MRHLWLAALLLLAGCETLSYYSQAIGGHLRLIGAARPIDAWLADPDTPPELRGRLEVASRIRAGLKFLAADKLVPAPDCGMKYLPRALAFAKLKALSAGAAMVRATLG